ncbi:hypothetical protein L917_01224 [Phytophthora nicotianae]|uniref:Uncharacterized protein n=1 Tax=Phytophthora nicotianae TaxID=4792 RepID=W2LXX2_PHYNI|nr:hypothetical protein L917_01224 [Phytophthora nicotianae]
MRKSGAMSFTNGIVSMDLRSLSAFCYSSNDSKQVWLTTVVPWPAVSTNFTDSPTTLGGCTRQVDREVLQKQLPATTEKHHRLSLEKTNRDVKKQISTASHAACGHELFVSRGDPPDEMTLDRRFKVNT